jgi:predicted transglutaminase-like cysteine proteinase
MRFIAAVMLFPLILSASSVFSFTEQELLTYHQRFGPEVSHRINGYEKSVRDINREQHLKLLTRVNTLVNSFRPEHDSVINKQEDYWSTPKEFLATGFGDCEEYAVLKYFTLQRLGVDERDMCLMVVKDRYSGTYHMVLNVYFGREEPMVLDNLSFRVLPFSKRVDLAPSYCINKAGTYTLGSSGQRTATGKKDVKFEDLMKRIGEGR